MPRVSLKERERKLLFDLACDNLLHLNDVVRQLEDDGCAEDELGEWRLLIEQTDALADKLASERRMIDSSAATTESREENRTC